MKITIVFSIFFISCLAQRSPYAGRLPIGFPYVEPSTDAPDVLGNRFGSSSTTIRVPLEARGDADLVSRLSKLPVDQQPFWFINWQALEEMRNNPQTYPHRGNIFIDNFDNSILRR